MTVAAAMTRGTFDRMSPVDAASEALDALMARYRELVRRVASRYRLSDELLDETLQEMRIRLWRAFPNSRQLDAAGAGYVYRSAVTAALVVLRRRRAKRESGVPLTPEIHDTVAARAPSAIESIEESELAGELARAIGELAPARQAAVRLHLTGYHRDEIAGLLGWSEAKTRNLLYRGLDDLRALLTARGIGREATV